MNVVNIPNIRIVLIGTTHPGNIGAAARAMKSMGINELTLVQPQAFPHPEAQARATSAANILENAKVVSTLKEAIEDCSLAIATSCQLASLRWPELAIREMGPAVLKAAISKPVAIVFGRERTGMHIEEIQQCQYLVQIPTNPDCRSLNLAAAVQVICYEVMMAGYTHVPTELTDEPTTIDEIQRFHKHLFETLEAIEFFKPERPKRIRERLIRLFAKAQPDQNEVNILRGILTAVDKSREREY